MMQFFSTVLALAGAAAAMPAISANEVGALAERQLPVCSGLSGSPVCCATDVLGVVVLNCDNPPNPVTTTEEFVDTCASIGQQARCCTLPILGQALICSEPVGYPGKQ